MKTCRAATCKDCLHFAVCVDAAKEQLERRIYGTIKKRISGPDDCKHFIPVSPPETNLFDKVEEYENCTVQVLTNTITGEVSVGWWRNNNG